ncbi:MAG: hypothetical protein JW745_07885 [Sedimentisphaerales bacterium]|nr:hypothetical protein [Sedimentisphaerales bacterium]MBN2842018.1 hypothetical protein [Sedimentisphaerales bacterium]
MLFKIVFPLVIVFLTTSPVRADLAGRYFCGTSIQDGVITTEGLTENFSRIDANIEYWNGSAYYQWQPISSCGNNYTVEWTGYIWIAYAGEYGFGTISDDGSQIWINGEMIVDNGEGQWYDWEDNLGENDTNEPPAPIYLSVGYHQIKVMFYEGPSYDGIELWWLLPGSGPSEIPYTGTDFHGANKPKYNPNTNWIIVPACALLTPLQYSELVCGKDRDGDGNITLYEFALLAGEWLSSGEELFSDYNLDGMVDQADLLEFLIFWLKQCDNLNPE